MTFGATAYAPLTFSHPDFYRRLRLAPDQPLARLAGLANLLRGFALPPVGNLALPRRWRFSLVSGNYRRFGRSVKFWEWTWFVSTAVGRHLGTKKAHCAA